MNLPKRCRPSLGTIGFVLLCSLVIHAETKQSHSTFLGRAVQITFGPRAEVGPALSRDGKWLAFEYTDPTSADKDQIWVMDLKQGFESARPLVKDQNYNSWPSWSPDSQWISFMSGRKLTN